MATRKCGDDVEIRLRDNGTGMNRGAIDFVTKPVDFDDLTVTLNRAVEHAALSKKDPSRVGFA